MLLGQNAAPVAGDPVYSLLIRQGKYLVSIPAIGNVVPSRPRLPHGGCAAGGEWR